MIKLMAATGMVAFIAGLGKAQTQAPLAFEVASVKQHVVTGGSMPRMTNSNMQCPGIGDCGISGNRFTEKVASLKDLIMDAYKVRQFQISGLPSWGSQDVYDIAAKVEGDRTPTLDQVRRMLQTLLADRFQLKLHHETKEVPVYALVIAKNGPKLFPSPKPCLLPERLAGAPAAMFEFMGSWEMVEQYLSEATERPVIDKTALKGAYCTADGQNPILGLMVEVHGANPDAGAAPRSIFTLVEEKWGLKLESQKARVDVLVIDHAERPTEN